MPRRGFFRRGALPTMNCRSVGAPSMTPVARQGETAGGVCCFISCVVDFTDHHTGR